jgi:hypothetical protein
MIRVRAHSTHSTPAVALVASGLVVASGLACRPKERDATEAATATTPVADSGAPAPTPPASGAGTTSPAPEVRLGAEVPAGYVRASASMPGLDAEARRRIEAGEIFLHEERHDWTLVAAGRAGASDPAEDCPGAAAAIATTTGAVVIGSAVVDLRFGKVCRIDLRHPDSVVPARFLTWRLREGVSVMVACNPFEDGQPSGLACMAFAASLRAT